MEIMIDIEQVAGDLLGMNASDKENGDDDGEKDKNDDGTLVALS